MENQDVFSSLRKAMEQRLKEAYLEGAHKGSITTCATLYHVLQIAGIKEPNIFYDIIKDIASKHGCEDLAAETSNLEKNIEEKEHETETLPLS